MDLRSRLFVLVAASAMAACASTESQTDCSFTGPELERIKVEALAFLLSEWPVEERCQQISDVVIASDPGKCAISGEPLVTAACPQTTYLGYSIVFDQVTKQFEQVHFKTE